MSKLVSDEILLIEAELSFFVSIWLRLQTDCVEIMRWLENPRSNLVCHDFFLYNPDWLNGLSLIKPTPASVQSYMESGLTLYASIADALDLYVAGIDPSYFANGHNS